MPWWFDALIAALAALVTTGATLAVALTKWSWWAGARVGRVDTGLLDLEKRIARIEKVLNGQLEEHK